MYVIQVYISSVSFCQCIVDLLSLSLSPLSLCVNTGQIYLLFMQFYPKLHAFLFFFFKFLCQGHPSVDLNHSKERGSSITLPMNIHPSTHKEDQLANLPFLSNVCVCVRESFADLTNLLAQIK